MVPAENHRFVGHEVVFRVDDHDAAARLVVTEPFGHQSAALVWPRRAAVRIRGCDEHNGTAVRHGKKLSTLRTLEERRKVLQVETETLQAERNSRSKSIGEAKARGEDIEAVRREVNLLGDKLDAAKSALDEVKAELRTIALNIPNLPADEVPFGKDDSDNPEVSRWGTPKQYDFEVRDHVSLGEMTDGLDFPAAVKLTGARFVVMKGQIARLHRANNI